MNYNKLKQCMGTTDKAYLKCFGELPFDTLERLQKGGFSVAESWNIVNNNILIVSEILDMEYEKAKKRELETALLDCPFVNQPPT